MRSIQKIQAEIQPVLAQNSFRQAVKRARTAGEGKHFEKTLIASLSAAAFAGMMGVSGSVLGAAGTTEIADSNSITASDAAGLLESDASGAVGITVDSTSGAITLGANGTESLSVTSSSVDADVTIAVTTSGTASGVIFADDITTTGNAGSIVAINATNDNVTFQGSIDMHTAPADINIGSGSADPTLTMTVDTVNNENLTIEATIDAVDADDTVTLAIDNTDSGNANTVTFSNAIGSDIALDAITIGAATTVTFSSTVAADTITNSSANTTTFGGDVTGNINFAADGTISIAAGKLIDGSVDNLTGSDGAGTLTIANTGSALEVVSGTIGATNSLLAVGVDTTGGAATFTGAVNAATITESAGSGGLVFTGGATFTDLTALGDVTGNLGFAADGDISIATTKKIIGSVDNLTGSDGAGTLTIANTGGALEVVSGTIGATNSLLAVGVDTTGGAATFTGAVNVVDFTETGGSGVVFGDGATVTNLTAAGAVTVTDLTASGAVAVTGGILFSADGTITFNGAAAQTPTGAITTGTAGTGTVVINNTLATGSPAVTFTNDIGATDFAIGTLTHTSGDVVFNGAVFAKNITTSAASHTATFSDLTLSDGGTVTFNGGKLTIASGGSLTLGDTTGMTIAVGSGVAADATLIDAATNAVAITDNGTITLDLSSADLDDGDEITIVSAASGIDATYTAAESTFFDYEVEKTSDTAVTVTAAEKSTDDIASDLGLNDNQANAYGKARSALAKGSALYEKLVKLTGQDAKEAAEQLAVQAETMGAASAVSVSSGTTVTGMASTRLASLRTGEQYEGIAMGGAMTGFASGGGTMTDAFWLRPFGNWIDQDKRGGVDGYEADTYGISAGVDTQIFDNTRVGVSYAYSDIDVDGEGVGESNLEVDAHQFTVYGDYTAGTYYVEGMLGYARNGNEASNKIDFAGVVAKGSYDADQFMASIGGGMPIALSGNAYVTPTVGLAWTHYSPDKYTETGAGGLNKEIEMEDMDAVVGSLGAKFHTKVAQGKGYLMPSAHVGLSYDFADDDAQATSSYVGSTGSWTTPGMDVPAFSTKAGLGMTYDDGAWSLSAGYEAEFKSDYNSHAAMVQARWKF